MPMLPDWARWNGDAAEQPWSVGVEEELVLIDPRDSSAANRVEDVLEALPPELAARASRETHACVLELKTEPHLTVHATIAELCALRQALAPVLRDELGLEAAGAGTHPLVSGTQVMRARTPRYREVGASMRALARREPTMALHVHVAVPRPAAALRALDGLRTQLPLLLALSANSPFWRGEDSGFASIRTPLMSAFPRTGIPRRFGSYERYAGIVDALIRAGAIPEPTFLWWDARLQPRLGTLEVRVADSQSRVEDVAALAALVQCLVVRLADGPLDAALAPELLEENRFLAARDGMQATLIDGSSWPRRPVLDAVDELVGECEPAAVALGCSGELAGARALSADPGCERQRRAALTAGVRALPGLLARQLTPSARPDFTPIG